MPGVQFFQLEQSRLNAVLDGTRGSNVKNPAFSKCAMHPPSPPPGAGQPEGGIEVCSASSYTNATPIIIGTAPVSVHVASPAKNGLLFVS